MLAAGAGVGLALLAWQGSAEEWGALPLAALIGAAVLDAAWWGNPFALLLAAPALALLVEVPERRAPALPLGLGPRAVAVGLAYLALAAPVEAMALGSPPAPASLVTAPGVVNGDAVAVPMAGGEGALEERRVADASGQGGAVEVVGAVVASDADLRAALRQAFDPGAERSFFPFLFLFEAQERTAREDALSDGWVRVALERSQTTLFLFFPIPMRDGERQLVLLRPLGQVQQPSLLPPFFTSWTVYGGFHLREPNATDLLQRLSGNVAVAGQTLAVPPGALAGAPPVGRFATPGPGPLLLLAAVALAAMGARGARRNR
jgi:hypothetical protein